jgi:alkanesulfonate monooxygenase SsuD/methylene tetrahydromethanopterin reductase-like flavin-dependent oxidoreductase (luciferase family)
MRFGVTVYQPGPYEDLLAFWKDADRLGFDSAFLFDHLMPPARGDARAERCMEAWSLLSALAVATSRLRLGVLVTANTFRHPALVAKMAATVDQVSKGRLIIGLGAGWMPREHAAYGIPFYTPSERAKRLAEAVKVVKLLLTQEHSTFSGRYYTLKDAPCEPKGVQNPHPPMLVGGLGPKVVQPAAARHAQIWHFFKPGADVAEIRRLCEGFDAICRRVGRDPGTVEKATSVLVPKDDAGYKQLPQQIADLSAAGIRYVMFLPPPRNDRAALSRLAETVLPTSRAG